MKNLVTCTLFVLFCGASSSLFSQNVGINTTGATPSNNAILDLNTGNSNNMGLLIPNVTLGASLSTFGLAHAANAGDKGMMVYNSVATNQAIGYYCWNGSTWISVTGSGGSGWSLTGDASTSPGTNYIGTSDGNALEFKVNAQKSGWIDYSSAIGNTGLGYQTMVNNTGSQYNTAMGYQSLYSVQYNTADSNTAIGFQSLYTSQGNASTAVGFKALYSNAYGVGNTALGNMALYNESSGNYNTALGYKSLYNAVSTVNDVAIGTQALYNNSTGQYNIGEGYQSLYSSVSGQYNVSLGYQSMYNDPSSNCVALGYQALYGTSGQYATNSIAIGYKPLYSVTYGSYNIGVGDSALYRTTGGNDNVAIGTRALYNDTAGSYNVAFGYQALQTNTGGSNNTAIGHGANVSSNNLSNATAIGNGATVKASNSVMIGNSSVTTVAIGAGAYVLPVQDNTATSGTITSNGSQLLNLTGNASSLTLVPPSSPVNGQLWEVTTNQTTISTSWTGSFVNAPVHVTSSVPAKFFYDSSISKWVNM